MLSPTDKRWSDAFARDLAAALRRRDRGPSRQSLVTKSRKAAAIPAYLAEFRLTPGTCRGKRCASRFAVTRLTVDTRQRDRTERMATLECASCGRVWRRVTPPKLSEYQTTRLTLILPGTERHWYARGHYRKSGEDAVTLPDASQLELVAALDDWKTRNGQYLTAKARATAKKAAAESATHTATMDLLARLAELDAARLADDARPDA